MVRVSTWNVLTLNAPFSQKIKARCEQYHDIFGSEVDIEAENNHVKRTTKRVVPDSESEGEGMGGTLGINTPAGKKTGTAAIVSLDLALESG
jgi:hypothetical protein